MSVGDSWAVTWRPTGSQAATRSWLLLSAQNVVYHLTSFVVIKEALVVPASHYLIRTVLREDVFHVFLPDTVLWWKQVFLFTDLAEVDMWPAELNGQERLFHLNNEIFCLLRCQWWTIFCQIHVSRPGRLSVIVCHFLMRMLWVALSSCLRASAGWSCQATSRDKLWAYWNQVQTF